MKNQTTIANLRKKKGWTQEKLAEKCGISVRTVQRLESGKDGNVETLNLVAQVLAVQIDDLFKNIGNQDKQEEILNYSFNQEEQIAQRKSVTKLYKTSTIIFCNHF